MELFLVYLTHPAGSTFGTINPSPVGCSLASWSYLGLPAFIQLDANADGDVEQEADQDLQRLVLSWFKVLETVGVISK
jgi:hypothetical protein